MRDGTEPPASGALEAVVLVDDVAVPPDAAEHGFAVWIRYRGTNILFDTGQGEALFRNAARRGVPLETADYVVLSHGHYDHTGGVVRMLEIAPQARFIAHPGVLLTRFAVRQGEPVRSIGMREEARPALLVANHGRVVFRAGPYEFVPGAHLTGTVARSRVFEDVGGPFFLDERGLAPDPLNDDQALWCAVDDGCVVFLGCAHAGVVNTLDAVRRRAGDVRVHAVIGGMHLLNTSQDRLRATIGVLRELNIPVIAPCHCSGGRAVQALAGAFPGAFVECRTGTEFRFPDSLVRSVAVAD